MTGSHSRLGTSDRESRTTGVIRTYYDTVPSAVAALAVSLDTLLDPSAGAVLANHVVIIRSKRMTATMPETKAGAREVESEAIATLTRERRQEASTEWRGKMNSEVTTPYH